MKILILLGAVGALLIHENALACSCAGESSPGIAFSQNEAVFSGKIIEEKKAETILVNGKSEYRGPTYKFIVNKAWKGVSGKTIVASPDGMCGYHGFQLGKEYLVYAYKKETMMVSQCGRTKKLGDTSIELMILDSMAGGKGESSILSQLPEKLIKDPNESVRAEAAQLFMSYATKEQIQAALPNLLHGFSDSSSKVRRSVLSAISRVSWIFKENESAEISKAIIKLLKDPTPEIRKEAARLVSRYDHLPEAELALKEMLKIELAREQIEQEVISAIAFTLAEIGKRETKKSIVSLLLADLENKKSNVRSNAAQKLGLIGIDAASAVQPLIIALKDQDQWVRYYAADALGLIGLKDALPGLIDALSDREFDVRASAAQALFYIGDEKILNQKVIPTLVSNLNEYKYGIHYHTLRVLESMGPNAAGAIPALQSALRISGKQYYEIYPIVNVLENIGPRAKVTTPELIALLKNSDATLRNYAVSAIGQINDRSENVIQSLIAVLSDGDPQVRFTGAKILYQWKVLKAQSQIKDKIVPVLISRLKTGLPEQKIQAALHLGYLGYENTEVLPALTAALSDLNLQVKQNSILSLGLFGPRAADAVPQLNELLKIQETRRQAIITLGLIGKSAAVSAPYILPFLEDKEEWTRYCAAEALRKIGTLEGKQAFKKFTNSEIPRLVQQLKNEEHSPRGEAARYLAHLAPETLHIMDNLIYTLKNDSYWLARSQSAKALGELGLEAEKSIPSLVTALSDRQKYVREEAIGALNKIGTPKALAALKDFHKN